MPHSPLVSKIRVHNPNKKGAASANRNGLHYIATREGVSLERVDTVDDLLKIKGMEEKEIRETLVHQEASDENYLRYIAKRPRSHGLFGNVDTEDLKAMEQQVARLTKSGRIIYRGIISLSEQDATDLGFRNINAWNNYLKEVMPDVAQSLGVSCTDHTWVAAYHAEESHPHIHFMLWDNQDKVKSPFIHKVTQQKIRILLEEKMFDNEYERALRQTINEELNPLRNKERDYLINQAQEIMKNVFYVPGTEYERLPQRVPNEYLQEVSTEVEKLISMLPGKGSFKYEYMPPEVKEQLHIIVDKLLERPDMQNSINKRLDYVARAWKGYSKTYIKAHQEKDMRDMRTRIANRVLKEVKENFQPVIQLQEKMFIDIDKSAIDSQVNTDIERNLVPFAKEMIEQNPVPFIEEDDEQNPVPFIEEDDEQNSVSFIETEAEATHISETDEEIITDKYFMEWTPKYKEAVKLIYDKGDIQTAYRILKEQAAKGNALALNELAKIIEKELVNVPIKEDAKYYNQALIAFQSVFDSNPKNKYIKDYAAYRIGKLYEFGKGDLEIDYKKAEEWYKKSAGNKFAQYSLAKMYLTEKVYISENQDIVENQKVAVDLLKSSSDANNPFASFELGNMYQKGVGIECNEERTNMYYEKAFTGFLKMATNSTDDALYYRIGLMYLNGLGTEQNSDEGEKYIQKAAEFGNANAKLKLSTIYLEKEDVTFREKATEILLELAEKENDMAQYKLGIIHLNEEKPEYYDMPKALNYLEQAAEQGNQYAQYKLGSIHMNEENPEYYDMPKALNYLEQAAEQANEYARYKLGCIHANEENPEYYDMPKALNYLEQAAEQGNEFAQYKLGCIHSNEEIPEYYDMAKAVNYLEQAAEQANEYARYKLGCIHLNEETPEYYNMPKAIRYLEQASEQGNQYAQCRLGVMYYFGKGVEREQERGKFYLEQAAEQGNEFARDVLENPGNVGIDFSYCLLKGVLSALETMNRQKASEYATTRTQSRQAMREKYLHQDEKKEH